MALFEIVMPKMGESIQEATITKWFIKPGDTVEEDDTLLEIATDKVDSEVPSPVDGVVKEVKFKVDDVVPVGEIIAIIDMDGEGGATEEEAPDKDEETKVEAPVKEENKEETASSDELSARDDEGRFYSPVVRNMAKQHGISKSDLDSISGSGLNGRVTKEDVQAFIDGGSKAAAPAAAKPAAPTSAPAAPAKPSAPPVQSADGDEIVEMGRMRKIIADHMVMSKSVSPHVTSVVEADVTKLVNWRNKTKGDFEKKYGTKLTFTPMFTEAVAKALRDYPMVNVSVDGSRIIKRKHINVGMAVALPDDNLIVPVIKDADTKNLAGLASDISNLAVKARSNKLDPSDIQGGTFTITNFGSFKGLIGTPIINQPQVAILATGAIQKVPAVIETPDGDMIAIRQKMFLSLSYDHRVVDGMLGGNFLKRIADYLEEFDTSRTV